MHDLALVGHINAGKGGNLLGNQFHFGSPNIISFFIDCLSDATTITKGAAVNVVVSLDSSINVPLGGFLATPINGKTVVLPNAQFTGAGDADGNAEISYKI